MADNTDILDLRPNIDQRKRFFRRLGRLAVAVGGFAVLNGVLFEFAFDRNTLQIPGIGFVTSALTLTILSALLGLPVGAIPFQPRPFPERYLQATVIIALSLQVIWLALLILVFAVRLRSV